MTTRFDRRSFLGALVGGVAVTAAVRTFPFRVFSFPSEVSIPQENFAIADPTISQLGATFASILICSANYIEGGWNDAIAMMGVWDWRMLAQREAFKGQTLFKLPRDTDHGSLVTES